MGKVEIQALVEGGKASGGPPIGPQVGPTGVPIGDVVDTMGEKTKEFKGLKVPVTIVVDTDTRSFEVRVAAPMASALLLKELNVPKGSGKPNAEFVGSLSFEQVVKVAKMKRDSLNALELKTAVKTVLGTAVAAGVKCDGKTAKEVLKDIDNGVYDKQLKE